MSNNPYTVLSKQPKQKKTKQKPFEKVCVMCRTNKQNYSNGDSLFFVQVNLYEKPFGTS